MLPDFVLRNRPDSAVSVGAAVIAPAGYALDDRVLALDQEVPERTVRSWRQRFFEQVDELTARFSALCVEWGGLVPRYPPTPVERALVTIKAVWQRARRRFEHVPAPWSPANLIVGSQLLSSRVDLPWPIVPSMIGRSRGP